MLKYLNFNYVADEANCHLEQPTNTTELVNMKKENLYTSIDNHRFYDPKKFGTFPKYSICVVVNS